MAHSLQRLIPGWTVFIALCTAVAAIGLHARQNNSARPVFEVASIKPNNNLMFHGGRCHGIDNPNPVGGNPANNSIPLGRCVLRSMSLKDLIQVAYRPGCVTCGRSTQGITGGAAWTGTERFDLEAKAEEAATTTNATLIQMLRNLLADRFKLKLRTERQEVQGFVLVVGKDGPRLSPSEYAGNRSGTFYTQLGTLIGTAVRMPQLAEELSFWLTRPVQDKTGMSGTYDIRLRWTPGLNEVPFPPSPPPPGPVRETAASAPEGPSMVSAVQQQLGLRLVSERVWTDVLIIESAEKPAQQ